MGCWFRLKLTVEKRPRRQLSETLRREQLRLGNHVGRLITAYQEGLFRLTQLCQRMSELNKKSRSVESKLQSLEMAAVDHVRCLQLHLQKLGRIPN